MTAGTRTSTGHQDSCVYDNSIFSIHGYNWLTQKEADDKMKNMPSAAHAEPQDDLPVAADPAVCCLRMLVAGWCSDVKYHGGTGN